MQKDLFGNEAETSLLKRKCPECGANLSIKTDEHGFDYDQCTKCDYWEY